MSDVCTLLHRDDSQLIFLIDPGQESLSIVVVDSSVVWPVTVEVAGLKESVSLLEQEVVVNQLLSLFISQRAERVVLSFELSIKFGKRVGDSLLNRSSLIISESWSQWELCQVSSNSNSCADNHGSLVFWEIWSVDFSRVVFSCMLGCLGVLVVVFDDFVKQVLKDPVGVMRSSVDSNARVEVLKSRPDGFLEGETVGILLVVVLVPDVSAEVLAQQGLGARWAHRVAIQLVMSGQLGGGQIHIWALLLCFDFFLFARLLLLFHELSRRLVCQLVLLIALVLGCQLFLVWSLVRLIQRLVLLLSQRVILSIVLERDWLDV